MHVAEVMTRDVTCCRLADSTAMAARIMWDGDCGCVPILDSDDRVRGMLTDRDIAMAAYVNGRGLADLAVQETMSSSLRTCQARDPLEDALSSMSEAQVRRLPVVDEDCRVVGVISLADILQAVTRQDAKSRRKWSGKILAALTEITSPRVPLVEPEPVKTIPAVRATRNKKKARGKRGAHS